MHWAIEIIKWGGSMSDLIDKNTLIEDMSKKMAIMLVSKDGLHPISMETVIDYIKDYPTVESKLVVYGKWENGMKCSRCGQIDWTKPDFCPKCGADMRKKVE